MEITSAFDLHEGYDGIQADLGPNPEDGINVVYLPSVDVSISNLFYDETNDNIEQVDFWNALNEHSSDKKLKYNCTTCGKIFRFKSQLSSHAKSHSERVKSFQCSLCTKAFSDRYNLHSHQKIHLGAKPYNCSVCKRQFSTKRTLGRHAEIHTGIKPYKCKFKDCNKRFLRQSVVTMHHRLHTGKPYKCRFCERTFQTKGNQDIHERIHLSDKPYKCEQCEKRFTRSCSLQRHIKTELHLRVAGKSYLCSQCGHSFLRKSDLKLHEQRHSGIKNYQCQWCQKYFERISELITHKRIHTGEKPFKCETCLKSFTGSGALRAHERIHSGEKRFQCEECGKAFTYSTTLTRHIRIHTGEKPYSCQYCMKKFARRNTLVYHENSHSGLKSHQCLHCGILVSSWGSLRKHEKNCDGNPKSKKLKLANNNLPQKLIKKSVQCVRCGAFFSSTTFKKHESKCNGDPSNNKRARRVGKNNNPPEKKKKPFQCGRCGVILKDPNSLPYHEMYGCTLQEITDTQIIIEIGNEDLTTASEDVGECIVNETTEPDLVSCHVIQDITHLVPIEEANSKLVIASPQRRKRKTGEGQLLPCQHCGKEFSAPSKLEVHSRIHTGIKPFKCSRCEKSFNQKVHLITHMITIHSQGKLDQSGSGEDLFGRDSYSSQSEMIYSELQVARRRKRKVVNTSSLCCRHCGKRFSAPSKLEVHSRIHTGIKPFKCSKCEKSFNQKVHLSSHMAKVHSENNVNISNECVSGENLAQGLAIKVEDLTVFIE